MKPTFSIQTKLYVAFGLLFAVLLLANFIVTKSLLSANESTELVDSLGRQRMLAQAMAKLTVQYVNSKIIRNLTEKQIYTLDRYIDSMRETYTNHAFDNFKDLNIKGGLEEYFRTHNETLFPATFTRLVNKKFGKHSDFYLDIISSNPVNPNKVLKTNLDKEANDFLKKNPGKIFSKTALEKGNIIFYSYSPDIATSQSCVSCHEKITKKPIRIGDILGIRTYKFVYAKNAKIGTFELNVNLEEYEKIKKIFSESLNAFKSGGSYPVDLESNIYKSISPLEGEDIQNLLLKVENHFKNFQESISLLVQESASSEIFRKAYFETVNGSNKITDLSNQLVKLYSAVSNNYQDKTLRYLQISIIFISLIMLSTIVYLSKSVTQPIRRISAILKETSKGNLEKKTFETDSKDEIGILSYSCNTLLEKLKSFLTYSEKLLDGGDSITHTNLGGDFKKSLDRLEIIANEKKMALLEANRANQAKSEFLSRMSHELRTPLNAVIGFSQVLIMSQKDPLNESQKEDVELIKKSGEHLLNLINEILDLSRIESGKMQVSIEPVNLSNLIKELLVLINPIAIKSNISINDEISPKKNIFVLADTVRLKQTMMNLISNAIKYNREKGSVTLSCIPIVQDELRINVSDTGIGISKENQEKVFAPFDRLDADTTKIEGTGIGLTITKKLVELMNGSIGFESELGKGSTFYIDLPTHQEKAELKPEDHISSQLKANKINFGKKTVLYIEDNAMNLALVDRILSEIPGLKLYSAPDARLGLEIATAQLPDIILMDINLPGMNGIQALKCLKNSEETKKIPVIAISANAMKKDIDKALAAGFNAYLTKPIEMKKLLDAIQQFILDKI